MSRESGLRTLLRLRRHTLAAYEAWERSRPPRPSPHDVLALIDSVRLLLPPEVRAPRINEDGYVGVRRMQECLSVLGSRR